MRTLKDLFGMFFGWTDAPSKTIGGAALIIATAGVASRLLGFIRDRLLASQFGAGDTLDAYYAAFRVPDTIYNLLVMGALSAAFVPVFTGFLAAREEKKAWKLAAEVLEWLVIFLGAAALLAFLFADGIVGLLAPGFSPEKRILTTEFTRIMLLSPIFLGISAVFGGILISFNRFVSYSFAPLFYNLGIIAGILLLVPSFGKMGLAYGVVLGAFLHMAVQIPAVKRSGFSFRKFTKKLRLDGPVRHVIRLMIPRSLAMAVTQIGFLLTTVFASMLVSGSFAVFNFAYNIQSIPLGLFGVAFSLAAFPILSLAVARKDGEAFFGTLSSTTIRILFFVVPLSMFFIIFRAQFVRVILGSGQFNWEDTRLTFEALKWFSISLFAQSLIPLFARGFFALQNTRTPLYIALGSEAVHIVLLPILIPLYGVSALAMAFSVGSILNCILLYSFLKRETSVWRERELFVKGGKILLATLFAGIVAQLSKSVFILSPSPLDTFVEVFEQLALGLLVGGTAFFLASEWLEIEELHALKRFILRKVLRLPEAASSVEGHPEKGEW
jgi:putative peptidoglycan lipid II flippase